MSRMNRTHKCTRAMLAEIVELGKQGMQPAQIATKWGISENSINNWRKSVDGFEEAFQQSRTACKAWWLDEANAKGSGARTAGDSRLITWVLSACHHLSEKTENKTVVEFSAADAIREAHARRAATQDSADA